MMKVKDLIKELVNHCDMDDDIFINVEIENTTHYYSVDGLENSKFEYRGKPTLASLKVKDSLTTANVKHTPI